MRRRLLILSLLFTALTAPPSLFAQSVWELTPYRVQLAIILADEPALSDQLRDDLGREVTQRCEAVVGPPWDVTADDAPAALERAVRRDLAGLSFDDIPRQWRAFDKIMLLFISHSHRGFSVFVREWDGRTRQFGAVLTRRGTRRRLLGQAAFEAVVAAFCPLAKVEEVERKTAKVRLRGGSLRTRDPSVVLFPTSELFRPVVRFNHADGGVRLIRPIPWTYLTVESAEGALFNCRIHTGLRSPLSGRRRGRTEQLVLAVKPPGGSTRLEIAARTKPHPPLEGYAVYAYSPDSPATTLLGFTDRRGGLMIPPGDHPLRLLIIKSGNELLARLPLLPGEQPLLSAHLRNDDQRLRVEGFIVGLQERMVEVVAQRALLLARANARLESGKLQLAEKLLDEAKKLPQLAMFRDELNNYQRTVLTNDPTEKRKIDRLFEDTRKVLQKNLDATSLSEAARRLEQAKKAAP